MPIVTPNPNGTGDDLGEELEDGDIVLVDENGNKIRFKPIQFE